MKLLLVIALSLVGAKTEGKNRKMSHSVTIVAQVIDTIEGAMHDHMDDGHDISYNAFVLRITSPDDLRNKELTFYNQSDLPTPPILKKGKRVSFTIDRKDITAKTLFIGAAQDLKGLDSK